MKRTTNHYYFLLVLVVGLFGCGGLPKVNECAIDGSALVLHCSTPKKKLYDLTPTQSNGFICESAGDFLALRTYYFQVEEMAASCNGQLPDLPHQTLCAINGASKSVLCSEGTSGSLSSFNNFICISSTDYEKLSIAMMNSYQTIADCP